MYTGGLRLSETMPLRVADIDSDRLQIRVHQGKGAKDRYTLLAQRTLDLLRIYWQVERPTTWLFPGVPAPTTATRLMTRLSSPNVRLPPPWRRASPLPRVHLPDRRYLR